MTSDPSYYRWTSGSSCAFFNSWYDPVAGTGPPEIAGLMRAAHAGTAALARSDPLAGSAAANCRRDARPAATCRSSVVQLVPGPGPGLLRQVGPAERSDGARRYAVGQSRQGARPWQWLRITA